MIVGMEGGMGSEISVGIVGGDVVSDISLSLAE